MVSSKEIKEKIGFYYRILQKGEESMAIKNKILIISLFLLLIGKCFGEDIEITKIKKLKLVTEWRIEGEDGITDFEIDSKGNIYLAVKNRIKVYSFSGKFLKEIGKEGDKENYYEKEIIKGVYEYIEKRGERGGEFLALTDIAIDSNDNIYAADMALNKILKFDSSGHFIKKWGKSGIGDGEFFPLLLGIAGIDSSTNIYAYDTSKIHKFSSEAQYLSTIKIDSYNRLSVFPIKVDFSGNIIILDQSSKKILFYDKEGNIKIEAKLPLKEIEKIYGKCCFDYYIQPELVVSDMAYTCIYGIYVNPGNQRPTPHKNEHMIILGFPLIGNTFINEIQFFGVLSHFGKYCGNFRKQGKYFYVICLDIANNDIFMHKYEIVE